MRCHTLEESLNILESSPTARAFLAFPYTPHPRLLPPAMASWDGGCTTGYQQEQCQLYSTTVDRTESMLLGGGMEGGAR